MAAVNGILGSLTFAGATDLVGAAAHSVLANKWSASFDRDSHDVTPFSPTGAARKHIGGLHSMSGSIEGFLDGTTAHDISHMTSDDAPAAFVLTATTGRTYSFNGILTNWSVTIDVQGVSTWSGSFVSDGVVSLA